MIAMQIFFILLLLVYRLLLPLNVLLTWVTKDKYMHKNMHIIHAQIHAHAYLNPSAWEYQSATLDCIYHRARQSGTAAGDILDITQ